MKKETIFWSSVDIKGEDECWEWLGKRHKNGYGQYNGIEHRNDNRQTHRLAYKYTHPNEDISNFCVCHSCDNPPCCNPKHLFKGTMADNMLDKKLKGRAKNTKEQNLKISLALKGHKVSEEIRLKISETKKSQHLHTICSDETRLKLIEARKLWWQKRRDHVR